MSSTAQAVGMTGSTAPPPAPAARQVAHEPPPAEVPRLPHGVEPETHPLHPAGEHQAAAYTLVRNRCLRRPHLRARGLTSAVPALPARVDSRWIVPRMPLTKRPAPP